MRLPEHEEPCRLALSLSAHAPVVCGVSVEFCLLLYATPGCALPWHRSSQSSGLLAPLQPPRSSLLLPWGCHKIVFLVCVRRASCRAKVTFFCRRAPVNRTSMPWGPPGKCSHELWLRQPAEAASAGCLTQKKARLSPTRHFCHTVPGNAGPLLRAYRCPSRFDVGFDGAARRHGKRSAAGCRG